MWREAVIEDTDSNEIDIFWCNTGVIQSRVALATSFIALNKALGGGWLRPVNVSAPAVVDTETGPRPRIFPIEEPQP